MKGWFDALSTMTLYRLQSSKSTAIAVDLVRPVHAGLDDSLPPPRVRWCRGREVELGQLVAIHELHKDAAHFEVLPCFWSPWRIWGARQDVVLGHAQSDVGAKPWNNLALELRQLFVRWNLPVEEILALVLCHRLVLRGTPGRAVEERAGWLWQ